MLINSREFCYVFKLYGAKVKQSVFLEGKFLKSTQTKIRKFPNYRQNPKLLIIKEFDSSKFLFNFDGQLFVCPP